MKDYMQYAVVNQYGHFYEEFDELRGEPNFTPHAHLAWFYPTEADAKQAIKDVDSWMSDIKRHLFVYDIARIKFCVELVRE